LYLFIFGLVFGLVIQPLLDSFTSLVMAWVEAVKSKFGLAIALNNQKIETSVSEQTLDESIEEEVLSEPDEIETIPIEESITETVDETAVEIPEEESVIIDESAEPPIPEETVTPAQDTDTEITRREDSDESEDIVSEDVPNEMSDEELSLFVDEEISVGNYVLTGGELPACILVDCVARLLPGVLADPICHEEESISSGMLEYPQYTRPLVYRGKAVPQVLTSGNHRQIAAWRYEEALKRTQKKRPDLL
jgi:hypothetical protein